MVPMPPIGLIVLGAVVLALCLGAAFAGIWIDGGRPVLPAESDTDAPTMEVSDASPTP